MTWIASLMSLLDSHPVTAAWVQAIGAIAIILATVWIAGAKSRQATKHEQAARAALLKSIASLARNCLAALDGFLQKFPESKSSVVADEAMQYYAASDFQVPMDGLAAIPLHQVGNAELLTAVSTLRGVMGRIKGHLDEAVRSRSVMPANLSDLRKQRTLLFNAVANILRIVGGPNVE
jgi:hypothetical protein